MMPRAWTPTLATESDILHHESSHVSPPTGFGFLFCCWASSIQPWSLAPLLRPGKSRERAIRVDFDCATWCHLVPLGATWCHFKCCATSSGTEWHQVAHSLSQSGTEWHWVAPSGTLKWRWVALSGTKWHTHCHQVALSGTEWHQVAHSLSPSGTQWHQLAHSLSPSGTEWHTQFGWSAFPSTEFVQHRRQHRFNVGSK